MKRVFWTAVGAHAFLWAVTLGSALPQSPSAPTFLFGLRVPVGVAHTVLLLLFLGLPATAATAVVTLCGLAARWSTRRPRVGADVCPGCGYDLRASAERCPECGRPRPTG